MEYLHRCTKDNFQQTITCVVQWLIQVCRVKRLIHVLKPLK